MCDEIRDGLARGLELVRGVVGEAALARSREIGVVRAPMLAANVFFRLLACAEILDIVDTVLSPTAILHLQNGLILPPWTPDDEGRFQRTLHRDFNRVLNA